MILIAGRNFFLHLIISAFANENVIPPWPVLPAGKETSWEMYVATGAEQVEEDEEETLYDPSGLLMRCVCVVRFILLLVRCQQLPLGKYKTNVATHAHTLHINYKLRRWESSICRHKQTVSGWRSLLSLMSGFLLWFRYITHPSHVQVSMLWYRKQVGTLDQLRVNQLRMGLNSLQLINMKLGKVWLIKEVL